MRIAEAQFERQVIDYAQLMGWRIYHTRNSKGSVKGYPDLTMVRGTRLIFAELKTDTGKTSAAQGDWLDDLRRTLAEVYIWRPAHWPSIELTLRR